MPATQLEIAGEAPAPAEVRTIDDGIMAVIARAASDPSVDVDKLERLLAMQERVLARSAEQAFNEAMASAQEEIRPVTKNKKNESTNSKYATLDALSDAIDPIIHRYGFSLSFGTADSPLENHYRITCEVSLGGHSKHYRADVPVDMTGIKGNQNKTATHGFGSALSYGRRYLKLLIFDVATTDDDGQRAGAGPTITEKQVGDLEALIQEVGADRKRFLAYLRQNGCRCGDTLESIPAADYGNVVKALEAKRAK